MFGRFQITVCVYNSVHNMAFATFPVDPSIGILKQCCFPCQCNGIMEVSEGRAELITPTVSETHPHQMVL